MANIDEILYSIAAFICALFVLEWGADKFIDHTAILAKRTGLPEALIALLTAGAEWEELAVVIFSLARGRPQLAYGNVIGSAIANVLGAFSLGLLFYKTDGEDLVFDRSSRLYTAVQLAVTGVVAVLLFLQERLNLRIAGAVLITAFVVYVISIFWAIRRGLVAAPEGSDSDSDSDGGSDGSSENHEVSHPDGSLAAHSTTRNYGTLHEPVVEALQDREPSISSNSDNERLLFPDKSARRKSLLYHLGYLMAGFVALTLSAYVLSHAATTLVTALGINEAVFGLVILSIATTLPEKLIATVSGLRGYSGIMVANTVGSNIFLLTLCLGVIWVSAGNQTSQPSPTFGILELGTMVLSSVAMYLAVGIGGRVARVLGGVMLVAYCAFVVAEIMT
ncbi:hypothetical protein LTR62_002658 [Meristemomyces frigidus]|uniref:Sodium/calcium exchanger membrane region domain-containing protein n=1 Tax=Meristemomyces frigidus TaxID=1508187 RepID=A0AAN7YQ04_9PEZI|nr:hypothetical protein LTR62_002658 [Meristemomyces frigidus]